MNPYGCLQAVAGGIAEGATLSVFISSIMFGLPGLFLPRGVQQTSTDSKLLLFCLPPPTGFEPRERLLYGLAVA